MYNFLSHWWRFFLTTSESWAAVGDCNFWYRSQSGRSSVILVQRQNAVSTLYSASTPISKTRTHLTTPFLFHKQGGFPIACYSVHTDFLSSYHFPNLPRSWLLAMVQHPFTSLLPWEPSGPSLVSCPQNLPSVLFKLPPFCSKSHCAHIALCVIHSCFYLLISHPEVWASQKAPVLMVIAFNLRA